MPKKVFIDVLAILHKDGDITPLAIKWTDGRRYNIDEVIDLHRAVPIAGGGFGLRYKVRFGKSVRYLYMRDNRWFVEVNA